MATNRPYNQRPRRAKQPTANREQEIVEAVFRGIWQLLSSLFKGSSGGTTKGQARKAQLAAIVEHWEEVELHLITDNTHTLAVSEADKLLDAALQALGIPGDSMGERLKAAQAKFPPQLYQDIWQAHKVRNVLAHELGATISVAEARTAIAAIRQALYHLQILT